MVLQHVVGLGRGGGDGELAQHVVVAVQFLHDEEQVHVVASVCLHKEVGLGIANETRLFRYRQVERCFGRVALAEVDSWHVLSRSLVLELAG